MKKINLAGLLLSLVACSGCSTEAIYNQVRGFQSMSCNDLQDLVARKRCLADSDTSFKTYKKDTDSNGDKITP